MTRAVELILGGPGAGKTTYFIGRDDQHPGVIGELLAAGAMPHEIAYVSFTRKAAEEAAHRAMARFGVDRDALPHFRTLHSMAFAHLGVSSKQVMQVADYRAVALLLGVEFTGYTDPADGPAPLNREGDVVLQWMGLARARRVPLKQVWQESGEAIEWRLVKLINDTVEQYKRDTGKVDFADMLERVTHEGHRCPARYVIIDEAQDLSAAQWALARSLFRGADRVWLGGDDDQAIHAWAGADVEQLFRLNAARTVLPVSHRLPREVFDLATTVAKRIKHRFAKAWQPAEHRGGVHHLAGVDHLDLRSGGSWMLLARNRCFCGEYERLCREQGVPYATVDGPSVNAEHVRAIVVWERLRKGEQVTAEDVQEVAPFIPNWSFNPAGAGFYSMADLQRSHGLRTTDIWHDALARVPLQAREYYAHCLRNGYRLQDRPLVYVGTIHSVKGGEADNVVLRTDMTYRTARALEQDPDNEHRVFYTGITRAKKRLYIIDSQEQEGYTI